MREDKKLIENFETKLNEFTESQKMVNSTLDEVRRLLSEIKTAKNNRDIHLVAGQPWGYGGSAGVQELKDKLTSLEDLLDGQGARQEALLDEIERSIREMTKVAQKGALACLNKKRGIVNAQKRRPEDHGFNIWRSYSDMMAGVLLLLY